MKKIVIIGGGISGLSVLHYLKKRYEDTVEVILYERNSDVGGAISTVNAQDFLFETGPNGFLTNQPNTLEFIEELGFSDQIIEANADSKRRYVQIGEKLHILPMNLFSFIKTPLLSTRDKLFFIAGMSKKNISKDQSIYDYISKRFGASVAERLVDPFLTGIYAGNIKRLHMQVAFPKMAKARGMKSRMCSFKNGMGSFIQHLNRKYQSHIQTGVEITNSKQVKADVVIYATPAYVTSDLLRMEILKRIPYSSVAVVGLVIKRSSFKTIPDGFGYLIPSTEKKDILGVLIESNVFPRTVKDQMFLRVMIGGAHHPMIAETSQEELLAKAIHEIDLVYGLIDEPVKGVVKLWEQGIPQYELDYPAIRKSIQKELNAKPNTYLCANYLDGISFNDCIKNARELVYSL